MAHHPGPREAPPECKLRVGHPDEVTQLQQKSLHHLGGPHSRAMTSCDYFFVQLPPSGLMYWPGGVLAISCAPVAWPAASGVTPDLAAVWL